MLRHTMIETIGAEYLTSNIEAGEYSYVQAAGNRTLLESKVGHPITHFKLDLRFESEDIVILIETKQVFVDSDEAQLQEYLEEEKALNQRKRPSAFWPIPPTIRFASGNPTLIPSTCFPMNKF